MSTVLIAIPTSGNVRASLVKWLMTFDRMGHDVEILISELRPVEKNRQHIRSIFLNKGFDYLIQIDDDMEPAQDLLRIIDLDKDICSPAVWTVNAIGIIPLCLKVAENGEYAPLNVSELTECDAVGGGCTCIKREVLEAVDYRYMSEKIGGEDLDFCEQAKAKGFTVWYDPTIPIKHYTIVPL